MAERRKRKSEYGAAPVAVAVAVGVVAGQTWPVPDAIAGDSVWQTFLNDRMLVGLLRLTVVVVALYAIASIPASVVGGRWVTGVGTGGIVAGDAGSDAAIALAEARRQVDVLQMRQVAVESELDELWRLVDEETRPA